MLADGLGDEPLLDYLHGMADLLDLPLPADRALRVLQQFRRTQAIAGPLMAFSLPDRLDPLPEFEP